MTIEVTETAVGLNVTTSGGKPALTLFDDETAALRAHFQAERDADLGRWRWPEQPNFVVYRLESEDDTSGRYVEVLHEPDVKTTGMWEDMLSCGSGNEFAQAARAYFAAHPEPKPWRDAKHEEVWLVTANGDTGPMLATYGPDSPREGLFTQLVAANGTRFDVDDPGITAGRRIWPEEEA